MFYEPLSGKRHDEATLSKEAQAWVDQRNGIAVKVQWQFTTADARIKLMSLYPKIDF